MIDPTREHWGKGGDGYGTKETASDNQRMWRVFEEPGDGRSNYPPETGKKSDIEAVSLASAMGTTTRSTWDIQVIK